MDGFLLLAGARKNNRIGPCKEDLADCSRETLKASSSGPSQPTPRPYHSVGVLLRPLGQNVAIQNDSSTKLSSTVRLRTDMTSLTGDQKTITQPNPKGNRKIEPFSDYPQGIFKEILKF